MRKFNNSSNNTIVDEYGSVHLHPVSIGQRCHQPKWFKIKYPKFAGKQTGRICKLQTRRPWSDIILLSLCFDLNKSCSMNYVMKMWIDFLFIHGKYHTASVAINLARGLNKWCLWYLFYKTSLLKWPGNGTVMRSWFHWDVYFDRGIKKKLCKGRKSIYWYKFTMKATIFVQYNLRLHWDKLWYR